MTNHAEFRAARVFPNLDGLRCLSVVAVVWHHTVGEHWASLLPVTRLGFLGVDLFFVLSGFLIVTLLLRERDQRGSVSLRHFYVRRALRIFPLYYGMLALLALGYFVFRPHSVGAQTFRDDLPYLLVYLTNWVPAAGMLAITWSLAAEEQFYLLWPAVEKFFARGAVALLVLLVCVSQVIHFGWADGRLLAWFGWHPDEPGMLRETTFTPILLGVALAHGLHRASTFGVLARWCGGTLSAPGCLLALVLLGCVLPVDLRGWGRLSVHVLLVLLLASVVVRPENPLRRLLTHPSVVRVGVLSYGIYLFHPFALALVEPFLSAIDLHHPLVLFVVGLTFTVGLAALSHRYYETPFLRAKARFQRTA